MITPQTQITDSKNRTERGSMRATILNVTLYVAAVFSLFVYFSNFITLRTTGNWWTLYLYTPGIIAILVSTFFHRIPYAVRSYTLILFLYIVGIVSMITYSLAGTGRTWLVFVPILAAILLGLRPGIVFLVLSGITWAVFAYLAQTGIASLSTADLIDYMGSSGAWTTGGFILLALAAMGAIPAGVLLNHLERTLDQQKLLIRQVENERANLEETVNDRTKDIERRLLQIRTASDISRAVSAFLNPDELLNQVCNLVRERFNLYYVGIFVLDDFKEYAVLKAGTGEAGEQMMARGHKLVYGGTSMVGWACQNRQARIALDIGADAVRFSNPFLPQTRSELALPLISGDRVLGAMTIQSDLPSAFDENDIALLQGFADSIATAMENARLYAQAQQSLDEVHDMQRQAMSESWLSTLDKSQVSFDYENPILSDEDGEVQSYEIPIKLRGQTIGKITVTSSHPIGSQEHALLDDIANETAVALENARLMNEIRVRSQQEQLVGQISLKAQGSLDLQTVMRTSVQELGKTLRAQKLRIRLGEQALTKESDGNGAEGRS